MLDLNHYFFDNVDEYEYCVECVESCICKSDIINKILYVINDNHYYILKIYLNIHLTDMKRYLTTKQQIKLI